MEAEASVVGTGPAGLMAAEVLAQGGARVTLYERMATPGRKFLMAGRGGLNITHTEPLPAFSARYGRAAGLLAPALDRLSPDALRDWCAALGQETFVGSSGRVFPKAWKASPLLRAWLGRLAGLGVTLAPRHRWTGWDAHDNLVFETPDGAKHVRAGATVLALGGASWPALGTDGSWTAAMSDAGLPVAPLRPSNSSLLIPWSDHFREKFEGQPLKGVAFRLGDQVTRGEALVTRTGLEGGGIYPLSAALDEIGRTGAPMRLVVDLRPDGTPASSLVRLAARGAKQSLATVLRKTLNLSPLAIALLRETSPDLGSVSAEELAARIHAVPLDVAGVAPLARAISTAGGLSFDALDAAFMLKARPGTFVAGEMLDWDAPTGGYLLQACFALGVAAGDGALNWLRSQEPLRPLS